MPRKKKEIDKDKDVKKNKKNLMNTIVKENKEDQHIILQLPLTQQNIDSIINDTEQTAVAPIPYEKYDCFNSDNKCSSAYINTLLRDKIPIIFTNSVEETVKFIKIIYDKLEHIPDRFVTENNSYISTVKTKTKKIENIDKKNCFILQLCQIPMINTKIASKIAEEHESMKEFLDTLSSWEEPIKYLQAFDCIGCKKAEKIVEYLL